MGDIHPGIFNIWGEVCEGGVEVVLGSESLLV